MSKISFGRRIEPNKKRSVHRDTTDQNLNLHKIAQNYVAKLLNLTESSTAWKAVTLPLSYSRLPLFFNSFQRDSMHALVQMEPPCSPLRFTNISKSTTAFHISGATCCM